jgi:DinB superfamily
MDAQPALRLLDFSNRSLGMNLQDVTHEESLVQPPGGGNCLNWVLGHIVVHRDSMLALMGRPALLDEATTARYRRGSPPVTADGPDVQRLDVLRDALERSYQQLRESVSAADEAAFAAPSGKGTLGDALIFLLGHEWYHGGQVGLLRRITGHAGAIQ